MSDVKIWNEVVTIPTYVVNPADKNPLFFEKRVYQGSSGKVYPLPVSESITDEKVDKQYNAVFIENDYLKIMLLPELGGRIQRAYDKTNGYDFVYYNEVIKPALVGLVGPWISGGIEFNWPQHHRPSTFMPTEYKMQGNLDGSKTVIISEIDQMYGTKGMMKVTLFPDKSYIRIDGQLFNRTDIPQTFLWWANPAVPVNENTFSVFPPDVNAVMDHGKRAVSTFPIATGTYYKYDYSEGIDISKYKNIKVPTSYMAYHSDYDFVGNYDQVLQAGLLHIADHHISPGKKQWTWGSGDFGKAWDRNLTDKNGPYIELMTGVFTDNQPDFTWIKPYEEKNFTQYFMPYKGIGRIKNANKDASLNIEVLPDGKLELKIYVTSLYKNLKIVVNNKGRSLFEDCIMLSPVTFYEKKIQTKIEKIDENIQVTIFKSSGEVLLSYRGMEDTNKKIPEAEKEILAPTELKTNEELFLAAQHLEQYRHATLDAEEYYIEGLKRDNTDIRINNAYGLFQYRRGDFEKSEKLFRKSLDKITWKTPNPYSGEPVFNLGLSLLALGEISESYDCFYKATWNEETRDKAYFQLAKISSLRKEYAKAQEFIEKCLDSNRRNMKACHMHVVLLRINESKEDIISLKIDDYLSIDPLDMGLNYEKAAGNNEIFEWKKLIGNSNKNYTELVLDYIDFGLEGEALNILNLSKDNNPMLDYIKTFCFLKVGNDKQAKDSLDLAEKKKGMYCFPNRLQEQNILEEIINKWPEETAYARYSLGNLLYDKKRYKEAVQLWESCLEKVGDFATVQRNLSFAYFNIFQNDEKAFQLIEKAFELDRGDSRILLEKDNLSSKIGMEVIKRKEFLEINMDTVEKRDDLYTEYIHILNCLGESSKALEFIEHRNFHPWEGGEGRISSEYRYCLIELAKKAIYSGNNKIAVEMLERSKIYPQNLGEGKLPNVVDCIADYYLGKAFQNMNMDVAAKKSFESAIKNEIEPSSVLYYNDQPIDDLLYQGLSYIELGNISKANKCFNKLKSFGNQHFFDKAKYDYFAVSLPETISYQEDLQEKNKNYCLYVSSLGEIGLGEIENARTKLLELLESDPANSGVLRHLEFIKGVNE